MSDLIASSSTPGHLKRAANADRVFSLALCAALLCVYAWGFHIRDISPESHYYGSTDIIAPLMWLTGDMADSDTPGSAITRATALPALHVVAFLLRAFKASPHDFVLLFNWLIILAAIAAFALLGKLLSGFYSAGLLGFLCFFAKGSPLGLLPVGYPFLTSPLDIWSISLPVSGYFGIAFGFLALWAWLRGRPWLTGLLAGVTAAFQPATAVLLLFVFAGWELIAAYGAKTLPRWKKLVKECAPATILILLTLLPSLDALSIKNREEFYALIYALLPYHVFPWGSNPSHYILGLVFCAAVTLLLLASGSFPKLLRSKLIFLFAFAIFLALFSCVAMECFAFDLPARYYFHKLTLFPVMLAPIVLFSLLASDVRPYAALMSGALFLLLVFKAETPIILYLCGIGCLSLLSRTKNAFLQSKERGLRLAGAAGGIALVLYLLYKSATPYDIIISLFIAATCICIFVKKMKPMPWLVYSLIFAGVFFHDFHRLTLGEGTTTASQEAIRWLKTNTDRSDIVMLPSIMRQNQFVPTYSYNFALADRPAILGIKEANVFVYIASLYPQIWNELEKFYSWRVEPGSRRFQKLALAAAMDRVPLSGVIKAKEAYPRLAYVMRHTASPLPLPAVFSNAEYTIYSLKDQALP